MHVMDSHEYMVLPSVLSLSPRVLVEVVVAATRRERGISVDAYVDDWLVAAPTRHEDTVVLSGILDKYGQEHDDTCSRRCPSGLTLYSTGQNFFVTGKCGDDTYKSSTVWQGQHSYPQAMPEAFGPDGLYWAVYTVWASVHERRPALGGLSGSGPSP